MDRHLVPEVRIRANARLRARWDDFAADFPTKAAALRYLLDLADENGNSRTRSATKDRGGAPQKSAKLLRMSPAEVKYYNSLNLSAQAAFDEEHGVELINGALYFRGA